MTKPCAGLVALAASLWAPQALAAEARQLDPPTCSYTVVDSFPHDSTSFTQGLVWSDGELFESTGLTGQSKLLRVELATGSWLQRHDLASQIFGEGLVLWQDRLIQITWQNQVAFVYDSTSFAELDQHTYAGEGWGLTHDGSRLVMSDGSSALFFRDPDTFALLGQVQVHDDGVPVIRLNELEYIRGRVWANVWLTDLIVRIDPVTGQVTGWIDLAGLLGSEEGSGVRGVLNGIAHDPAGDRLFVTGKNWPTLYEIQVVGCADPLVFSDGFDWGDTAGWSELGELRGPS